MNTKINNLHLPNSSAILGILVALFVAGMIAFPATAFAAARGGLSLWWQTVLPALLPFFIASELLVATNTMAKAGRAMQPLMWPLFRLPGAAALAVAMGFCSGFPTGAAVTASLVNNRLVSRPQAARLIAFTNNASPMYIMVTVATGILQTPAAAALLLAVHYLGNILIGLLLRFDADPADYRTATAPPVQPTVIAPPGQLMKNAASKAFANVCLVGCYIVLFAVLAALINQTGFNGLIAKMLAACGLEQAANALARGFWEMTIGIESLGGVNLPLYYKLPLAASILAWGGISVQAQVAAMVADSRVSCRTYLLARLVHTVISYPAVYILTKKLVIGAASFHITPLPVITPLLGGLLMLAVSLLFLASLIGVGKIICRLRLR